MTTPAQQVKELFGSSLPSFAAEMELDQKEDQDQQPLLDDRRQKWPKQAGKGKGHQLDKRPRDDGRSWNLSKSSDQKYDRLRTTSRPHSAFLLYMETRPDMSTASGPYQPFTNHFFAIAQRWQKVKEETPTKLDLSLRSTLLLAYMTEFHERLRHALEPNSKETSVKAGWLQETPGAPPCWTYAKWDATKRESILDTSKPPVTHSKVLDAVARSLTLLGNSNLIHRFRATRPLALEYEANILTFLMLVSNRSADADQLFSTMELLTDCNATQLMRTRFAKERLRRQPLAQALQREASNLLQATNPHSSSSWGSEIAEQPADCFGVRLFNWASLLQGWRNLTQQQDAAEFSDFLLERLLPPAFQGHYQCALATAGEPAALLLSNDGTAAKPVKANQMPWIEANCYMVRLRAVQP
ncbi:hypothetical protein AK812_SmicGene23647 [Symbiodinium microadriaticum]|uniref:Uncharacterized protein n=1 Tax=Symbiodinium microadriaticum TaxID=2951 RepID=A0A1Q9DGQ7_SYMMI|nr:hypothetical protein AK812_SmicGene23647 [Symbiodinium microadriaticum]